uniref:Dirigent protein n=1 Tax=Macrostomum lignano TaxID=282301 RepID=A0A1I8H1Y7_9PLAT
MKNVCVFIILIAVCVHQVSSNSASYISDEAGIVLDLATSSNITNDTNTRNEVECMVRCRLQACAAATFVKRVSTCQLLVIYDANLQNPGLMSTHVARVMQPEAGDQFWKMKDFDSHVISRKINNFTTVFKNSSTGSVGSIRNWTIGVTGCYLIEGLGAGGGGYELDKSHSRGAKISGLFNFSMGSELSIVVGQLGGNGSNRAGA